MVALIIGGAFIAGVGVGLALVGSFRSPEVRPCTCECHCASPVASQDSTSSSAGIFWFAVYLSLLISAGFGTVLYLQYQKDESSPKGKGRRGTFGAAFPLQLRDGPSIGR